MTTTLAKGRWTDANHERLARFLDEAVSEDGDAPVAIFDFDNTVVRGDTGSLFYLDMVESLRLDVESAGLRRALDVLGDGAADRVLDRMRDGDADGARDAMIRLYLRVYDKGGMHLSHPWVARVFAGIAEGDLRAWARSLAERQRDAEERCICYEFEGYRPSVYLQGVRPYPESVDLLERLRARGFENHVVTGTFGPVVEEFCGAFDLAVDRVHGMRTVVEDGVCTDVLIPPHTVGGGKLDVVRERIGRRPRFVAGDSISDMAMMLYCAGPCLVIGEEPGELNDIAREKNWLIQPVFGGAPPKPL